MECRRVATKATRRTDRQSFMVSLMMCRGTRACLTVDDSMVSLSRVEHYINVSEQRYTRHAHTHGHRRPLVHFIARAFHYISTRPTYEHVVSSVLKRSDRSATVISGVMRAFVPSKQLTHVLLVKRVDDRIDV